jgi:hypothetical protein
MKIKEMFSIDLRSLALFRIGLASILLYDLCKRWKYVTAHYTDVGILSRDGARVFWGDRTIVSLNLLSGEAWFQSLLFTIAVLFVLMLLVGYRTRLVTILSWILLVSIQVRNPMIIQGGDQLMRIATFWAMFLPLGARYSIDSVRRPIFQDSSNYYSTASLVYVMQIVFVYVFSALFKMNSSEWMVDGSAISS